VLASARTVEVIIGPAGTGKTRVLATAARIWDGPVVGTATSQNATNELRQAGIRVAANTTRLLADLQRGRIPPGSLILADEGSMISITHLAALTEHAARHGCARSFKMRMSAAFAVRMCGREKAPSAGCRRGRGVRGGVVVVSLT
jgi:hypothetical protein